MGRRKSPVKTWVKPLTKPYPAMPERQVVKEHGGWYASWWHFNEASLDWTLAEHHTPGKYPVRRIIPFCPDCWRLGRPPSRPEQREEQFVHYLCPHCLWHHLPKFVRSDYPPDLDVPFVGFDDANVWVDLLLERTQLLKRARQVRAAQAVDLSRQELLSLFPSSILPSWLKSDFD